MSITVSSPSVCGSSSSKAFSACSSLFSAASYSTASSSRSSSPLPAPPAPVQRPALAPAIKNATVNLPCVLPPAPQPIPEVDIASLIVNDDMKDAPLGFLVGKLKQMGPSLLTNATSTTLYVPNGPVLPSYIEVSSDPSLSSALTPSHILAIAAPDSPRTLLVPVHGLLLASLSSSLSIISSSPSQQPPHPSLPSTPAPSPHSLPVVEVNLPSSLAFPLLQVYCYLASPSILLSSLLPTPPDSASSGISPLLNPTRLTVAEKLSHCETAELLRRVALCHGLWQNAVALGVSDEQLWGTMKSAWAILVGALALKEKRASADRA